MSVYALVPGRERAGVAHPAQAVNVRLAESAGRAAFWSILGLALLLRACAAWLFPGAHHPDETYQAFEQAHRYAFGYGIKPWEFDAGLRSTLLPVLLSLVFRAADALVGTPEAMLGASRLLLATLSLLPIAAIFGAGLRRSYNHALVGAVVAATWSQLVYFSYRPMTEAIAADFLLTALALVSFRDERIAPRILGGIGACLGLALMLRVHFAPAIGIVGLAACGASLRTLPRGADMARICFGAAAPIVAFGLADWIAWGVPFHAPYTAFRANLVDGIAARFGTAPFYTYPVIIIARLGWVAIPVALLLRFGLRTYALWLLVAAAILVPHSLIAHKEYRFVFLCAPILVIAASFASIDLWQRWRAGSPADPKRDRFVLTAVVAAWLAASLSVAAQPGEQADWHRQQAERAAFRELSRDPDLCGVALVGVSWTQVGGYSALHRPVPIFQVPANERPPDSAAFNTVLSRSTDDLPEGYVTQSCFDGEAERRLCLRRRPGRCNPDASLVPLTELPRLGDPLLYKD